MMKKTLIAPRVLAEFEMSSILGTERAVMERVIEVVRELALEPRRLERLKTAVSEAVMNAIEHGNKGRAELPVAIRVSAGNGKLSVRITDQGGGQDIPEPETPDIEAKLAGLQKARGWGLFLIKNMVDEVNVTTTATHHTLELVVRLDADSAHGAGKGAG